MIRLIIWVVDKFNITYPRSSPLKISTMNLEIEYSKRKILKIIPSCLMKGSCLFSSIMRIRNSKMSDAE